MMRRRGAGLAAGTAVAAAGVALVVAAAVVLVIALAGGGDDGSSARPATRPMAARTVVDRRFAVSFALPAGWRRLPGRRAIRLQSPDRRVGVSITTVRSRPDVEGRRAAVEETVRRSLRGGRVVRRWRDVVAGRAGALAAITGRNDAGAVVDALVVTVASPWRTYALTAFGSPDSAQARLRQGRAVFASLRFFRPGRTPR